MELQHIPKQEEEQDESGDDHTKENPSSPGTPCAITGVAATRIAVTTNCHCDKQEDRRLCALSFLAGCDLSQNLEENSDEAGQPNQSSNLGDGFRKINRIGWMMMMVVRMGEEGRKGKV